eukprot:4129500-Amphidinium_carterae.2
MEMPLDDVVVLQLLCNEGRIARCLFGERTRFVSKTVGVCVCVCARVCVCVWTLYIQLALWCHCRELEPGEKAMYIDQSQNACVLIELAYVRCCQRSVSALQISYNDLHLIECLGSGEFGQEYSEESAIEHRGRIATRRVAGQTCDIPYFDSVRMRMDLTDLVHQDSNASVEHFGKSNT